MTLCERYTAPSGKLAVVIEDDGKTCYAYLLDEEQKIVGDCWLCNRTPTPEKAEWHDPENLPFANPRDYVNMPLHASLAPFAPHKDLQMEWRGDGVDISLFGQLFAHLRSGAKPGWSRLAIKDGPLALRLSEGGIDAP